MPNSAVCWLDFLWELKFLWRSVTSVTIRVITKTHPQVSNLSSEFCFVALRRLQTWEETCYQKSTGEIYWSTYVNINAPTLNRFLMISCSCLQHLATLPKKLNPRLYSTFEFFTNSSIRNLWNNGNVKHREASAVLLLQLHPMRSTDQSDSSATLFSIYSIWIWTALVFKPWEHVIQCFRMQTQSVLVLHLCGKCFNGIAWCSIR